MRPPDLIPREGWYPRQARGGWLSLRVGAALGVTFLTCFVTGLISHVHQHPGFISLPPEPAWGYAFSQGLHVTSGIVSIPLLAVKLWSVAPRFWKRPLVGGMLRMAERGSVLVLVASAIFELVTGLLNVAQIYVFGFYFPPVHYAVAWLAIGAIVVHVAVQLPQVRHHWGEPEPDEPVSGGLDRRDVLRLAGIAALLAAVTTAGDKIPALRPFGFLSQRSGNGPQGLPVNRSAAAAGITVSPEWRLVVADGHEREFRLDDLRALPQHTAQLPIACVEGWNAWATWEGVRLAELIGGAAGVTSLTVRSPDPGGYGSSQVTPATLNHPDTLLALKLNGEDLSLDHGYPARLIAPNRPGAMQTKWVDRIEVNR